MKFLIDMNLSPVWVPFLASYGLEAIHWSAVGRAKASDSEILEFADANAYVIFTHDLDFGRLLALRGATGPSVVQIRDQDVLPTRAGAAVVSAIGAARSYLETGSLVTVDLRRHRVRLLPI